MELMLGGDCTLVLDYIRKPRNNISKVRLSKSLDLNIIITFLLATKAASNSWLRILTTAFGAMEKKIPEHGRSGRTTLTTTRSLVNFMIAVFGKCLEASLHKVCRPRRCSVYCHCQ